MKVLKWGSRQGLRGRDLLTLTVYPLILSFGVSCVTTNDLQNTKGKGLGHITGHIIKDIPFYPQEESHCGPASLAGVLNYWGIPVTPEDIAREIYSQSARGTLNIDMLIYAQSKGLNASYYSGGLDDLKEKIRSNHPLIVLVDYGLSILQVNHFMVVVGYNEDGIIVNSGREERKFIPTADFLKLWERTRFWTLLINGK